LLRAEIADSASCPEYRLSHIRLKSNRQDCPLAGEESDKSGWSWGSVSAIDSNGRTFWIADAHRGDGKRFVAHADEKLIAFMELEAGSSPVR
jgi:hypothetical protein